jgi:hypothetical protein
MNNNPVLYLYDAIAYNVLADAQNACADDHPELLDDDMPDFFNNHIEEVSFEEVQAHPIWVFFINPFLKKES